MASLQHSFCPLLSLEHNILLYESFTLSIYIQMKSWKRAVSVYVVSNLSDISLTSWTNTAWTYWHHEQILRAHIWASNIALHVSFLMNLHHWDVIAAPSPLSSASWACRSAVSNCLATLWWSTKRQASSLPSLSPCAKNYGHLSKWKQQIWGYRLIRRQSDYCTLHASLTTAACLCCPVNTGACQFPSRLLGAL